MRSTPSTSRSIAESRNSPNRRGWDQVTNKPPSPLEPARRPTRHLSPSRASALRGVRVLRRGSDRNETGNKGRHESNAVRPIRRGRTVSREGGRSLSSGSSSAARCSQPDHRRLLAADPHEEPQNVRFPDPRSAVYGSARARFLWPKDGMTISPAEAVSCGFALQE